MVSVVFDSIKSIGYYTALGAVVGSLPAFSGGPSDCFPLESINHVWLVSKGEEPLSLLTELGQAQLCVIDPPQLGEWGSCLLGAAVGLTYGVAREVLKSYRSVEP